MCRELGKASLQTEYYTFYQSFCYLYPDLHLYQALHHFQLAFTPFNETAIASKLKPRFIACWNKSDVAKNPPNGEYASEDDDIIAVKAQYSLPMSFSKCPSSGEWLDVRPVGNFFSSVIHLPREGDRSDEVVCMFESKSQVLYWVCPHCSAQNNNMTRCTACNTAIPATVVRRVEESLRVAQRGTHLHALRVPGLLLEPLLHHAVGRPRTTSRRR